MVLIEAYSAQSNGEEAASKTLRNTLVPPTFVQVGDKTFGEVTASKLVNYGTGGQVSIWQTLKMLTLTRKRPKQKFAEAKKELEAQGVTFPNPFGCPC